MSRRNIRDRLISPAMILISIADRAPSADFSRATLFLLISNAMVC
jgi:hypothetical protein